MNSITSIGPNNLKFHINMENLQKKNFSGSPPSSNSALFETNCPTKNKSCKKELVNMKRTDDGHPSPPKIRRHRKQLSIDKKTKLTKSKLFFKFSLLFVFNTRRKAI